MLVGGFIAVCMASTDYTQLANSYPNIRQDNVTQTVSIKILLTDIYIQTEMSIIIIF